MSKCKTLVATVVAAVSVAVAVCAAPAFATNETYPHPGSYEGCGKCASVNGKDNWIKNNESYNYSGEGYCDYGYLESGGAYYPAFSECTPSGKGEILCYNYKEFWGHGQTRRYYAMYEYNLFGRQDNYQECG